MLATSQMAVREAMLATPTPQRSKAPQVEDNPSYDSADSACSIQPRKRPWKNPDAEQCLDTKRAKRLKTRPSGQTQTAPLPRAATLTSSQEDLEEDLAIDNDFVGEPH